MWSQWDEFLLVWWSVGPGAVLMNSTDWKSPCCQPCPCRSRPFRMLWRVTELCANCLARRYRKVGNLKNSGIFYNSAYSHSGKYLVFVSSGTLVQPFHVCVVQGLSPSFGPPWPFTFRVSVRGTSSLVVPAGVAGSVPSVPCPVSLRTCQHPAGDGLLYIFCFMMGRTRLGEWGGSHGAGNWPQDCLSLRLVFLIPVREDLTRLSTWLFFPSSLFPIRETHSSHESVNLLV